MVDTAIQPGDVCVDLVQRGKVQVVDIIGRVADHRESNDYDIASYKANQLFDVTDETRVYKCVFLPENPSVSFSGTYDFPEPRLARVPVEAAHQDLSRVQRQVVLDVLQALIQEGKKYDWGKHCPGTRELAEATALPDIYPGVVDEARELVAADEVAAEGDDE